MRPDPASLMDHEVGPAKEAPEFPAIAFHGLHLLILTALAVIATAVEVRVGQRRPWPSEYFRLYHLVILSQWPILYGLDLALRRLGYKSRLKKPQTREVWTRVDEPRAQSSREVWDRIDAGPVAGPKGKPADREGAIPAAVVLRTDLQIWAGLAGPCLVGALLFAAVIVMAHASSPHRWPAGVGWSYAGGATLAILGGACLWLGLGTRWETRFDGAGITRVRFDRVRSTPWSAIGGLTILRHAETEFGPDTTLSFRDRDGRRLCACVIGRRHSAEVGGILALIRDRLPDLRADPLAEELA